MAGWIRKLGPVTKGIIVLSGGLIIGYTTYRAYLYYQHRKNKFNDEGFEETLKAEEFPEKRILVLGLDGAGKSSFLSRLSKVDSSKQETRPTEGFSVMCVQTEGLSLNIWEIGGAENVRNYWSNFLQDTDVLIFVVDSSDEIKLPLAFDEFHKLLGDERLKKVPILILANKQDVPGALTPAAIEAALSLNSVQSRDNKIQVLGISSPMDQQQTESVRIAEDLMISLSQLKK